MDIILGRYSWEEREESNILKLLLKLTVRKAHSITAPNAAPSTAPLCLPDCSVWISHPQPGLVCSDPLLPSVLHFRCHLEVAPRSQEAGTWLCPLMCLLMCHPWLRSLHCVQVQDQPTRRGPLQHSRVEPQSAISFSVRFLVGVFPRSPCPALHCLLLPTCLWWNLNNDNSVTTPETLNSSSLGQLFWSSKAFVSFAL